jgi:hypothetical protein
MALLVFVSVCCVRISGLWLEAHAFAHCLLGTRPSPCLCSSDTCERYVRRLSAALPCETRSMRSSPPRASGAGGLRSRERASGVLFIFYMYTFEEVRCLCFGSSRSEAWSSCAVVPSCQPSASRAAVPPCPPYSPALPFPPFPSVARAAGPLPSSPSPPYLFRPWTRRPPMMVVPSAWRCLATSLWTCMPMA